MGRFLKRTGFLLAAIFLVVFGITFAAKNPQFITLAYYGWNWEGRLSIALMAVLILGFTLGITPGLWIAFRARRRARRSTRSTGLTNGHP